MSEPCLSDVGCCVSMNVLERDDCGAASDDALHYVWAVAVCIGCVRFIVKVLSSRGVHPPPTAMTQPPHLLSSFRPSPLCPFPVLREFVGITPRIIMEKICLWVSFRAF